MNPGTFHASISVKSALLREVNFHTNSTFPNMALLEIVVTDVVFDNPETDLFGSFVNAYADFGV
jgi:hypothetical protein